jgi:amino acid transporter
VFWRIIVFYILGILITGMLVPYDDPDLLNGTGTATQSPYVIAIRRAGIHTLPSIINAAIFTSAFSAGNSFLFCSSRILYGLSIRGQAPRIFAYCTNNGLPLVAVLFSVGFLGTGGSMHTGLISRVLCSAPSPSSLS